MSTPIVLAKATEGQAQSQDVQEINFAPKWGTGEWTNICWKIIPLSHQVSGINNQVYGGLFYLMSKTKVKRKKVPSCIS